MFYSLNVRAADKALGKAGEVSKRPDGVVRAIGEGRAGQGWAVLVGTKLTKLR